jgi:hypothetical protein
MMLSELVSGGFYVTRLLTRPDGLQHEAPLPEQLLTLSSCLTEFLPAEWALEWSSCSPAERVEAIEKLGITSEHLAPLTTWATAAFNRGDLGWPCVWQSLEAARSIKSTFAGTNSRLVIVELGVSKDCAERLVEELAPKPREGESGVYSRLKSSAPLSDEGASVGWEPLGMNGSGTYHSWLCNGLQDDCLAQLGVAPGPLGLLALEKDARALIALIEQGLGAEPGFWFPGLLRRFD